MIWKPVPGYEGAYDVSNEGQVRSLATGCILRPQHNSWGYGRVTLYKEGKARRLFVHRIVATVFIEQEKGCNVVNHLDFNVRNNAAWNLEWTTPKGNTRWSRSHGRWKRALA